jgi:flagellar basal-body rod protein FlgF
MDSGLYSAYSGLRVNSDVLEILSNNLANVNTTGFKSDQAFLRVFNNAVNESGDPLDRAVNDSSVVDGSFTDFQPGVIRVTGRDLDVALDGRGFFAVQGPTGTMYTRNGTFQLDGSGRLINSEGLEVLGGAGPIQLPPGKITISKGGEIQVDGSSVDTLQVVDFPDTRILEKAGNSMFRVRASDNAQPVAVETPVVSGSLEQSNVNPIREMMLMINMMRQFESLQKSIYTLMNTVDDRSINQVGRVAG